MERRDASPRVTLPAPPILAQLLTLERVTAALLCTDDGEFYWYRHRPEDHRQSQQERVKAISTVALREAILAEPHESGWIPPGLARFGTSASGLWFVRWLPPTRYSLVLDQDDQAPPRTISVPLPGLVLCGSSQTYAVWASTETTFAPQARAYHAPLPNVGQTGHLCFGSIAVPPVTWRTLDLAWQRFITTPFNAHDIQGCSRAYPTDIRRQLLRVAQRQRATYPLSDLLPVGQPRHPVQIADVVQRFLPL